MQFVSKQIPCLQWVSSQVLNQEQTQEVRLDDSMPKIGRVLGAWGQVVLRGKEWRSGSVQVSGGVSVWVLYLPEEGGACQSVETWVPFQWKTDIPPGTRDGTLVASGLLRNVDARSLTPQKLMVRANVGLQLQVLAPMQATVYAPEEVPEHVQLRREQWQLRLPMEAGEKVFALDERLQLPVGSPRFERILYYRLQPEIIDRKVMADKVVFRGVGALQLVYLAENGRVCSARLEIPFAQYGELTGQYGEDAQAQILLSVTGLELRPEQDGGFLLTGGMTGQYVIYEQQTQELVTDAYSTRMTSVCQWEDLGMPEAQPQPAQTLDCQVRIDEGALEPVDGVFWPEQPCKTRTDDGLCLEPVGRFQLLGYDREGQLQVVSADWSGEPISMTQRSEVAVMPTGPVQVSLEGQDAVLRGQLLVDAVTLSEGERASLAALELQEKTCQDAPSLILRRASGDSLWELAKATGSTEDAIRAANGLEGEPEKDRMLLIPIV